MRSKILALEVWSIIGSFLISPVWAQTQPGGPGNTPSTDIRALIRSTSDNRLLGSVTAGDPVVGEVALSLTEAIERGLRYNLQAVLSDKARATAETSRRRALSDLLPKFETRIEEDLQKVNLDAFGFPRVPGIPGVIGPFSVFDGRVTASLPLIDLRSARNYRKAAEDSEAARLSYSNTRELVVLVVAGLYLETLAGKSRIEAAQAQLNFAKTSHQQAVDFKNSGLVPAIDVLRAQVEMQAEQQRLIAAKNNFEKLKLQLAGAIGLPLGQSIRLTETLPYVPAPPLSLEEALDHAFESRADYQAGLARVRAAETALSATRAARYPVLSFGGDYGLVGHNLDASRGTFLLAASVRIPIYSGGRLGAHIHEARIQVEERKAELDDLRRSIEAEVRTTLLDLDATRQEVQVSKTAVDLSQQQLEQAQDRFAAGIVSNLEVVQAQEAVAGARENYIASLNAHNLSKARLAKAMGVVEKAYREFLLGEGR